MSRKSLRILATSDLHGLLDGLREIVSVQKPDVLVIAGDIHPAVIGVDPSTWFRQEFFPFVKSLRCEVVAIPGNHDFWISANLPEILGGKKRFIPKNFHLLCDSEATVCGLRFYGTPWVPWINGRWCFEEEDEDLRVRFAAIPAGIDFLVTHSPPLYPDAQIDISLQHDPRYQRHFGSKSLRDAIERAKPRYCICGHIHSGDHTPYTAPGGTVCVNASRVDERYIVHYAPILLSVPII